MSATTIDASPPAACAGPCVEAPPGVVVFERRLTARARVDLVLGLAAACGLMLLRDRFVAAALEVGQALPAPSGPLIAVLVDHGLFFAPLLAIVVAGLAVPQRFGRAELGPDVLVLQHALVPASWARMVLPLVDVSGCQRLEHGVRIRARSVEPFAELWSPFVVPVDDDAAAVRLCGLIDAAGAPGRQVASAGSTPSGGPVLALAALVVAWGLAVITSGVALGAGGPIATLALMIAALARTLVVLAWRSGRVHAGTATLSIRNDVVPWAQVTACAVADGRLMVETAGGRRLSVDIGQGPDAARLRAVLAERLAAQGRPAPAAHAPRWARSRRRAQLATAPLYVAPFVALALALAWRDVLTQTDHLGQTLHVVYRRWDGRPDRVVLVRGDVGPVVTATLAIPWPGGPDVVDAPRATRVDLAAGRVTYPDGRTASLPVDATVLVIGPDGVRAADLPLEPSAELEALASGLWPDAAREGPRQRAVFFGIIDQVCGDPLADGLERAWPAGCDPLLQDGLERRCVLAAGRDALLRVRVERGVVAATITPIGSSKAAARPGCAGCAALAEHPGRIVRRMPDGTERSVAAPDGRALLAAVRAVKKGASVEAATSSLAPLLWAP